MSPSALRIWAETLPICVLDEHEVSTPSQSLPNAPAASPTGTTSTSRTRPAAGAAEPRAHRETDINSRTSLSEVRRPSRNPVQPHASAFSTPHAVRPTSGRRVESHGRFSSPRLHAQAATNGCAAPPRTPGCLHTGEGPWTHRHCHDRFAAQSSKQGQSKPRHPPLSRPEPKADGPAGTIRRGLICHGLSERGGPSGFSGGPPRLLSREGSCRTF